MATLRLAFERLWRAMDRETKWLSLLVLVLAIGTALLGALVPIALKLAVDALEADSRTGAMTKPLRWVLIYVLGLYAVRLVSELRALAQGRAEQRLQRRVAEAAFEHLLNLPMSFHVRSRTGAVADSVEQGLRGYQLILEPLIGVLLPSALELAAASFVLVHFAHAEYLAILGLAVLAYVAAVTRRSLDSQPPAEAVIAAHVQASATFMDSLVHVESVKSFSANRVVVQRYADSLRALELAWRRFLSRRVCTSIATSAILTAALGGSLALAVSQIERGALTLGTFVLIHAYVLRLLQPLEMAGSAIRDVAQGVASLQSLNRIMREPREAALQRGEGDPWPAAADLEFERVCFSYEVGRRALDDVSFSVPAGKTVAVVGANGSGKTTLIRLLLRLYEPQAGRIRLGGTPIDQFDVALLRDCVTLVPQDTILFHDTLANNIAFGVRSATRAGIEAAARAAGLHDFIVSLPQGYETLAGERGLRLSGGERQRIAIARAVLKKTRVLLFDEGTSALDGRTEFEVLRNLACLSSGRTTLVVAHRLATVVNADVIVVLHEGRVVESGTHAQLLRRRGHYSALWHAQHPETAAGA